MAGLFVSIYDFEQIGDKLPMHTHDEKTIHITVIAKGRFDAYGDGWRTELKTGQVIEWQPYDPHEFVALEAGSRMVNVGKASPSSVTPLIENV